jgi:uncharacterized membrane protein
MSLVETGVAVIHLLVAGVWTGSVVFATYAIIPPAVRGEFDAALLSSIAESLRTVSRASVLLLLLTGGHLAAARYTVDSLTGTTNGWLVLIMMLLWAILAALVEIGSGRVLDGTERRKVREPARNARRPLQAAAVVSLLLLVDGGLLAGGL